MTESGAVDSAVGEGEERSLWVKFVVGRDPMVRARLIQRYLGTVQYIASSLFARRPFNGLEFADYLQYGRVGLIEAVDRFDPDRGAAFSTYASYRIRGAILNGIESSTEFSAQSAYRVSARLERVESAQVTPHSGDQEELFECMVDMTLDLALGYLLEDSGIHRDEGGDRANDPYHACELKFLQERLKLIVEVLPERERLIIKSHYYDHIDFHLLAVMLGISKGRVSQLHTRGLRLLREACRSMDKLDVTF